MSQPLDLYLEKKPFLLLDGAMATELEKLGADLNHPLWSARVLAENPELILRVHLDYLKAGANIITSSSYQASFEGYSKFGYGHVQTEDLLKRSTELAFQAIIQAEDAGFLDGHRKPLVAASIGPYGAALADGSEYNGNYALSLNELKQFHRRRMQVLWNTKPDLLACETIPCKVEAQALIELLEEIPGSRAWLSFSCRNNKQVCSGESFSECVEVVNQSRNIVAVGVNCTSPKYVGDLLKSVRQATDKILLAYPNKGETWNAEQKCWIESDSAPEEFVESAFKWIQAGARWVGGCCRTSPQDIACIRDETERIGISHT